MVNIQNKRDLSFREELHLAEWEGATRHRQDDRVTNESL